jgi:hypothetical protein
MAARMRLAPSDFRDLALRRLFERAHRQSSRDARQDGRPQFARLARNRRVVEPQPKLEAPAAGQRQPVAGLRLGCRCDRIVPLFSRTISASVKPLRSSGRRNGRPSMSETFRVQPRVVGVAPATLVAAAAVERLAAIVALGDQFQAFAGAERQVDAAREISAHIGIDVAPAAARPGVQGPISTCRARAVRPTANGPRPAPGPLRGDDVGEIENAHGLAFPGRRTKAGLPS